MQIRFISTSPSTPPGPLRKLVGAVAAVAALILALMFSAVLLAVIAVVGTIAGAYWWWRTRELRMQWRELARQGVAPQAKAGNDDVYEGEVIRVVEDETHVK